MIVPPTLRQMQFFLALVRRGSFSKAAEDCLVSQSTLSAAVKEMEALLGAQLVDRTTRKFALTPAGEDVARRAAPILAMAEDLARATAARKPMEGAFHLGVIPTIAPFLLPKAMPRLRKAYPKLELYLREDLTAALVERLLAGDIDAALLAFPYDAAGLEHVEIGDDPFYFAALPDHPLTAKSAISARDLSREALLLLEDGHCLRDHALDACRLKDKGPAAAFSATSLFTLTQMAQSGLGATLLPKLAVDAGLAKSAGLKAIPLAPPAPPRKIGVAWRKGSARRNEAEKIAAAIKGVLA